MPASRGSNGKCDLMARATRLGRDNATWSTPPTHGWNTSAAYACRGRTSCVRGERLRCAVGVLLVRWCLSRPPGPSSAANGRTVGLPNRPTMGASARPAGWRRACRPAVPRWSFSLSLSVSAIPCARWSGFGGSARSIAARHAPRRIIALHGHGLSVSLLAGLGY